MQKSQESSKQKGPENDFVLVGDKSTNKSKRLLSPLYNTLNLLQRELPYEITHKRIQGDGVFYLKLPEAENKLFSDFQFMQCHLSINQYYRHDKPGLRNGLSTVHYTEVYEKKQTKNRIIVHVYFTAQGLYSYTQTKQYSGEDRNGFGQEMELSPDQIRQLRENCKAVQAIVVNLIKENFKLYTQAVENTNRIESELQLLPWSNQKKDIEKYLNKAKTFIDGVDSINRFSYTAEDKRGKWMTSKLKQLRALTEKPLESKRKEAIVKSEIEEERDIAESPIKSIPTSVCNKKKKAIAGYVELRALIKKITGTSAKLKTQPRNLQLVIEYSRLLEEINLKVLLLSCMANHLDTPQKKDLKTWQSLSFARLDLVSIFFDAFWKADLLAVKQLYPLVSPLLTEKHITDLLIQFANECTSEDKQKTLREMLTFLYENSSIYQFLINSSTLYIHDTKDTYHTLLTRAFFRNNLFAFEIFLEQGMHPNAAGMVRIEKKIPVPVILVLYYAEEIHNKLPFFKLAIQYGGHYSAECGHVDHGIKRAIQTNDKKKSSRNPQAYFNKKNYMEGQSHSKDFTKTFIVSSGSMEDPNYLELFIPQMSLEDKLELCGRLISHSNVLKRILIPSLRQDIVALANFGDLNQAQNSIIDKENQFRLFSILIGCPDNGVKIKCVKQLVDDIRLEIQALAQDFPKKLHDLQQNVLEGALSLTARTFSENNYLFDVALLVLLLDSEPSAQKYYSLMKIYIHFALTVEKRQPFSPSISGHLNLALSVAENTCFSNELMKTPIYQLLVKLLNGESMDSSLIADTKIALLDLCVPEKKQRWEEVSSDVIQPLSNEKFPDEESESEIAQTLTM